MAAYLGGLRGTAMRTLADLIAFNDEHCPDEMRWFGQELFDVAEATTGLDDPAYRTARALCVDVTRARGIDRILADGRLDAIVAPPTAIRRRLPSPAIRASRSRPGRRTTGGPVASGCLPGGWPSRRSSASLRSRSGGRRAAATGLHRAGSRPNRRMPGYAQRPSPNAGGSGARTCPRTREDSGPGRPPPHLSSSLTKEVP